MDTQYTGDQPEVETMGFPGRIGVKESQSRSPNQQSHSDNFLEEQSMANILQMHIGHIHRRYVENTTALGQERKCRA